MLDFSSIYKHEIGGTGIKNIYKNTFFGMEGIIFVLVDYDLYKYVCVCIDYIIVMYFKLLLVKIAILIYL